MENIHSPDQSLYPEGFFDFDMDFEQAQSSPGLGPGEDPEQRVSQSGDHAAPNAPSLEHVVNEDGHIDPRVIELSDLHGSTLISPDTQASIADLYGSWPDIPSDDMFDTAQPPLEPPYGPQTGETSSYRTLAIDESVDGTDMAVPGNGSSLADPFPIPLESRQESQWGLQTGRGYACSSSDIHADGAPFQDTRSVDGAAISTTRQFREWDVNMVAVRPDDHFREEDRATPVSTFEVSMTGAGESMDIDQEAAYEDEDLADIPAASPSDDAGNAPNQAEVEQDDVPNVLSDLSPENIAQIARNQDLQPADRIPPTRFELFETSKLKKTGGWTDRELHALIDVTRRRPRDIWDTDLMKWVSRELKEQYGVERSMAACRNTYKRYIRGVTARDKQMDERKPCNQNDTKIVSTQKRARP